MSMDLAIEFQFDIDLTKQGILPPANIVVVGVENAKIINDSQYDKPLVTIAGGMQANVIDRTKPYESEAGTQNTGQAFQEIWMEGHLQREFEAIVEKKGDHLVNAWFVADVEDSQSMKKATNSMAAMLKQAYRNISRRFTVTPQRAMQKGFSNRYIGTGQVFRALGAKLWRSNTVDRHGR